MKSFHVVFFRQRSKHNLFARSIQLVMNKNWNHVEIVVCEPYQLPINNDALSFGAIAPKSRKAKMSEVSEHYFFEKAIQLHTTVSDDAAMAILEHLLNKNYSFSQILLISMKILCGGLISWLPYVKLNLEKYLICTELVGVFMQEACSIRFEASPEMLTINDVEELAMKNIQRFT